MEGYLHFQIDWASLIVGSKFTIFALFYFVFEDHFPTASSRGAYIWRSDKHVSLVLDVNYVINTNMRSFYKCIHCLVLCCLNSPFKLPKECGQNSTFGVLKYYKKKLPTRVSYT